MDCFCFHIKDNVSVDEAWQELEIAGLPLLYSSEEFGRHKEIYGYVPSNVSLESLKTILSSVSSITPTEVQGINWSEQWAIHSPDFHEGMLRIPIPHRIQPLQLLPGPGFGDLSHPTTRLMMKQMEKYALGQHVIDIGTGSGILALYAAALGAHSVVGIDIDKEAIAHAKTNALFNNLTIEFCLPDFFTLPQEKRDVLILMNMIRSEQRQAWDSLPSLHHVPGLSIVSGVLKKERNAYLNQCYTWGWKKVEESEEEGWIAFIFRR